MVVASEVFEPVCRRGGVTVGQGVTIDRVIVLSVDTGVIGEVVNQIPPPIPIKPMANAAHCQGAPGLEALAKYTPSLAR